MNAGHALLALGILTLILGSLALLWLVGQKNPPLPLFMQLLNLERRFFRADTRVLLHDLRFEMKATVSRVDRLEQELGELKKLVQNLTRKMEVTAEPESKKKEAEILALRDKGYGAKEIARKLGLSRGEVELFLSLAAKRER